MNSATGGSVMVQVGEPRWTLAALHLACAVALTNRYRLILVNMVPASQVGWLGTEFGNLNVAETDRRLLREYCATTQAYGVVASAEPYQYAMLSDAIVDAAEYFDARIIFATLSHYRLPFWRNLLLRRLRRKMERQGRLLYSLDEPRLADAWLPYIVVPASPIMVSSNQSAPPNPLP